MGLGVCDQRLSSYGPVTDIYHQGKHSLTVSDSLHSRSSGNTDLVPQSMSDTTKIEIPTWKSMEKTYKVWFKELQAYFAAIGEHRVLDKN